MRTFISCGGRTGRLPHRSLAVAVLLGAALLAGCAGTPEWVPPDPGEFSEAPPVAGNYSVTWKNLNPAGADVTQTLVNASSDIGQQLASGRASSSTIKVVTDEQMGSLIAKLRELGFYDHATPGMGLGNMPDVPNQRGLVAVDEGGDRHGLLFTLHMGNTPVPTVYRDCKLVIMQVHAAVHGVEVRAGAGDGKDAERLFRGPKIKMQQR